MNASRAFSLLRLAALVALSLSVALLVDSLRGAPAFCAPGAGCDRIRQLGYGSVKGIPVPLFGAIAFGSLFCLSLLPFARARVVTAWAALVGGLVGVGLLLLQAFVIHVFCFFCVGVDTSALVAAVAAGCWLLWAPTPDIERLPVISWLALGVGAVLLPIVWSQTSGVVSVPAEIRTLWQPGKVNIVEFSDFECPYCRMLHPELERAMRDAQVPMHFVRKTVPLAMHPHARDASRAYICAQAQGQGDAMANALFSAEDLSPTGCEVLAKQLGLDPLQYRTCLVDPSTEAVIDSDTKLLSRTYFRGLPTLWVDDQLLVGARPAEDLKAAIERAASPTYALTRGWKTAAVVLGMAAMVLWGLRARRGGPPPPECAAQ